MCIIPMHVQKYVYTYEHVIPIARQRTVPESTSINLPPPPFPSRHLRPQRESESTAPKASVMRQANSSQPVHTITGNAPVAQILDGI